MSTVAELLAAPPRDGEQVAVRAHLHDAGGDVVACDVLAETFPPQPGGAQVPVVGVRVEARPSARRAEDTVWTADVEAVRGTWRDGRVHVTEQAAAQGAPS